MNINKQFLNSFFLLFSEIEAALLSSPSIAICKLTPVIKFYILTEPGFYQQCFLGRPPS